MFGTIKFYLNFCLNPHALVVVDGAGAITDRYLLAPFGAGAMAIRSASRILRAVRSAIPVRAWTPRPGSMAIARAVTTILKFTIVDGGGSFDRH